MKTELRLAFRSLARMPLFCGAVVLTIALGVGAVSTVFGVVYGVLYRPLPYPDPERLVALWGTRVPNANAPDQALETRAASRIFVTSTLLEVWRRDIRSFEGIAGFRDRQFTVAGLGDAARVAGAVTTANFFTVLGLRPASGRVFQPGDDQPGRDDVVVIGHGFWREHLGGDPHVLGRTIRVDGSPHTVIGVLGPDARLPLQYTHRQPALYTPISHEFTAETPFSVLLCVARLRSDRTVAAAQAEMTAEMRHLTATTKRYRGRGVNVVPLAVEVVATSHGTSEALHVMLGATLFVLLIAAANVANLLLVRAAARHRELAVRSALGAGKWTLMRPLLLESVLLAGAGGLIGLLVATLGTNALVVQMPADLFPRMEEVRVDVAVLIFGECAALVVGLLAALAPVWCAIARERRGTLTEALNDGRQADTAGGGPSLVRRALVILEVALSAVLLVGAGLLARTYMALLDVDLGVRPERTLTFSLAPMAFKYPSAMRRVSLAEEVLLRVRGMTGIQDAGAVESLPIMSWLADARVEAGGLGGASIEASVNRTTAGFFQACGVKLRAGRLFDRQDATGRVAIVNKSLALRLWPGEGASFGHAVGQAVQVRDVIYQIVGVVDDVRYRGPDGGTADVLYLPFSSFSGDRFSIVVRTSGEPSALLPAIRSAVRAVDPDMPLEALQTLEEVRDAVVGPQRFRLAVAGAFAGLALLLAVIGLYGVIAQTVEQRTQELGIRLALGAPPGAIVAGVVREGVLLAGGGAIVGMAISAGVVQVLATVLFGVAPRDRATYVAVGVTLVVVAALASLVPARHAASVDPVRTLRSQ